MAFLNFSLTYASIYGKFHKLKLYCSAEYSRLQHGSPLSKTTRQTKLNPQWKNCILMTLREQECKDSADADCRVEGSHCNLHFSRHRILKTKPVQNRSQLHRIQYSEMDIPRQRPHFYDNPDCVNWVQLAVPHSGHFVLS